MEDRRVVTFTLIILCCIAIAVIPVAGYDNVAAHPLVNKYAVEYFTGQIMPVDPYLATATLNGAPARGLDWNLSDGRRDLPSDGIVSILKYKSPSLWIIEGGFSQDEPEWWQALRHFYDPMNREQPWLTDAKFWRSAGRVYSGSQMTDPETDAVSWAFDLLPDHDYNYPRAKEYFTSALTSDDRNNRYYGQAWRSVGETMHMVSDMTIPDHVRNDGHAIQLWNKVFIDISPYEETTLGPVVAEIAPYPGLYPPANLNYKASPRQVMIEVATFTNQHFISQDSNPDYAEPDLSQPASNDGYIMGTIDGRPYRVAKKVSLLQDFLYATQLTNIPGNNPKLDYYVLTDQQKILVPTSVRASAAILDRFLPRFKVNGEIKTLQEMENGKPVTLYFLDGEIIFIGNKEEWPQKLTIRNGASIVNSVTGERIIIPVDGITGDNLNEFRYLFIPAEVGAKAGDRVYLEYDLGGYVVRSADIEIPEEYPTPTPTTPVTPRVTVQPAAASGTCPASWQRSIDEDGDRVYPCEKIMMSYAGTLNTGDPGSAGLAGQYKDAFRSCGCCDIQKSDFSTIVKQQPGQGASLYDRYFDEICGGSACAFSSQFPNDPRGLCISIMDDYMGLNQPPQIGGMMGMAYQFDVCGCCAYDWKAFANEREATNKNIYGFINTACGVRQDWK